MLLIHPAAKPRVCLLLLFFFFVPLLNSDIFQFSIWLSQPRREIHRIWKSFVQQSRKLLWSTHSLFGPLSGSNTTLTTFHATVHRIQQVTAILFRLSKNQVNTTQEKAGKLVIWFCSNLLHLFCIQLLIMFLSMQQSWLMATEQTRTPNEHNPPRTEEMKQCRIPVTPLPPPNQAFWPNTECFLTLSSPWSPTFPKEDVTVHCTKTSHCKFQVGKEVSSFQDCQWLMKLCNVLIKNRVAMFY